MQIPNVYKKNNLKKINKKTYNKHFNFYIKLFYFSWLIQIGFHWSLRILVDSIKVWNYGACLIIIRLFLDTFGIKIRK